MIVITVISTFKDKAKTLKSYDHFDLNFGECTLAFCCMVLFLHMVIGSTLHTPQYWCRPHIWLVLYSLGILMIIQRCVL